MTELLLEDFYKEIGHRIRSIRESKKIKAEVLAELLELSRMSIVNIEKGRHKPSIHTVMEIAEILGVPYVKLIPQISFKNTAHFNDLNDVTIISDGLVDKSTLESIDKVIFSIGSR